MSEAVYIPDYVDQAKALLVSQFRGKPKIEGALEAFVKPSQALEDTLFAMLNGFDLETAVGAQLDIIGKIVGEPRLARLDPAYRLGIKAKIGRNTSDATPERIIAVFALLTGATEVQYLEYYPATVAAMANVDISGLDTAAIVKYMQKVVGGGIRFDYIGSYDDEDAFAFFDSPTGLGFGDADNPSVGGNFASVNAVNPV
ncbi:MAG TPA: DUF2612 domain-containing protein [bacterium]|nr:DUF2612 domain-containing protein [bacterium]